MQPIGHDETNEGAFGPETWRPWGQGLIEKGGLLRAGFSMYNTDQEVDRLLASLAEIARRR